MVVVLVIVLIIVYRYRDRFMLALTGDDHLHGGVLDCIWWFMRCGGQCTGDWTRHLTNCCCLPAQYRNVNLVKACGRLMGFATRNVEIRNIVVGDLPFPGRGDFYITVQCAHNPDLVTSLAEDKDPKVVHFPEVLTLRMRASPLEEKVKIVVRELNVFGSTDLCEVRLSAMSCVDWRDEEGWASKDGVHPSTKRFEMKVLDSCIEAETPPWILLEFGTPTEKRDLDSLRGNTTMVRTATADGHWKDMPMTTFKDRYLLLDPSGHAIQEPDEDALASIRALRIFFIHLITGCNCIVITAVTIYTGFRWYIYSCYSQYNGITMGRLHNETFPMSLSEIKAIVDKCEKDMEGTGLPYGVPCRPSSEQVANTCNHLPYAQPEPGAGRMLMHEYFDLDVKGISCGMHYLDAIGNATGIEALHDQLTLCDVRDAIAPYDFACYSIAVVLICSTCCVRACGNWCIRRKKNSLMEEQARLQQNMREEYKTRGGTGLSLGTGGR